MEDWRIRYWCHEQGTKHFVLLTQFLLYQLFFIFLLKFLIKSLIIKLANILSKKWNVPEELGHDIFLQTNQLQCIPYARHYNPRFVYFLPTSWSSFMYCDLWPYVWLVFKSHTCKNLIPMVVTRTMANSIKNHALLMCRIWKMGWNLLLAKIFFEFHARVQKCHFGRM